MFDSLAFENPVRFLERGDSNHCPVVSRGDTSPKNFVMPTSLSFVLTGQNSRILFSFARPPHSRGFFCLILLLSRIPCVSWNAGSENEFLFFRIIILFSRLPNCEVNKYRNQRKQHSDKHSAFHGKLLGCYRKITC